MDEQSRFVPEGAILLPPVSGARCQMRGSIYACGEPATEWLDTGGPQPMPVCLRCAAAARAMGNEQER